ncbi:hypothetical protein [Bradyrhizobium erythrophlei]|uniref:Dolichyl-phosphate-mannose-protein mannosyltransferase n=1 Tax=Bradyrhizobium erythrophlei TaxID=1437360 RepID=A0A1M5P9Y4_9BRAD|nr:hypothetical protein [Bradyrhizobium erythrophlei]SHG98634.1 hypothetical protein SAMN05444169_5121 [Bradyrhizobium erythrophlei]
MAILLVLGFIDAWAGRRSYVAGDTVSYMDMASGIAGGDPSYAVNGHFSPLYPIILSVFIRPFQSDSFLEFSVVRAINYLIFVVAILLFQAFLSRFLDQYYRQFGSTPDSSPPMSRFQFTIVSYIIFGWSFFGLTMVSRVNPDMCVIGTTFAAAAILLSFKDGRVSRLQFILFGAVLGIGYLFKTIFFPLSFIFLIAAALEPRVWAVKGRLLLSVATFLLIASPLIAALSMKYDHLTYGESGKLSYWTEVLQENPGYVHWQGDPPKSGAPEHPTRKIFQDPDVYEFASPIVSTYPPWFGTTYWNAGAAVRFDLRKQAEAVARNLGKLAKLLWMVVPLVVLLFAYKGRVLGSTFRYFRSLWLVGIANVGIYLVVVIDGRYLAGCLPLLAILSLAAVRVRNSARNVGTALVAIFTVCVALQCGPRLARATAVLVRTHGDIRDERWLVAEEFQKLGVQAGTPVAAIDYQRGYQYWPPALISDWARLARVHVVSEVAQTSDERKQFWQSSPDRQALVLRALRGTGARIVVASGVPAGVSTTGWTQIQNSGYYYQILQ